MTKRLHDTRSDKELKPLNMKGTHFQIPHGVKYAGCKLESVRIRIAALIGRNVCRMMNYLWFILTHFMPYAIWVYLYHYFASGFVHIRVSNKNE